MEKEAKREFSVYVVQVPDEYTVIINYGKSDRHDYLIAPEEYIGVGDSIKIIQPGKEVIDPQTNEVLGYYDLVKAKLEVVEMYENFSVCKDVEREKTSPLSTMTKNLSPMFIEKTSITYKALNVSDETISGLDALDKEIRIGDPVIF